MRVSVTLLDAYRYWRDSTFYTEESEQQSLDELIMRIRGEKPPQTDKMLRGIAFHEVMEHPHECYDDQIDAYESDGWIFSGPEIGMILMALPDHRVCEVKLEQDIGPVTLVGITDYMDGMDQGELKLTSKSAASWPDYFGDSFQWRAYLKMGDCSRMTYHVARPLTNRKTGLIKPVDYTTFTLYRTQDTDIAVERLVHEFYEFAQPYLEDAA